ncbi:hypothetical protein MLD38_003541 [Melastoma candidum]|uniref:Uncharacterized protein n=1 Tax=Melastoma candidum TaxID=119954 RepID=A0ACB9S2S9_9MYRT|nr:hypothetical protein MLD38_003541 [Melastoma candidum]
MENNCCYNLPPPTPYRPFLFPPPAPVNPSYLPPYEVDGQDNGNSTPTWVIVGSVVAIFMFFFFLCKCIIRSRKDSCEAKAMEPVPSLRPDAAAISKAIVPSQSAAAKTEPGAPAKEGKPTALQALPTGFTSCPSCGHRGGMYTFSYICPSCYYKQETNRMYPEKK